MFTFHNLHLITTVGAVVEEEVSDLLAVCGILVDTQFKVLT